MSATHDVNQLADELISQLLDADRPADRFPSWKPHTAGVNVWGEEGRYPLTSVVISDAGEFHDYAWGPNSEHTLPIGTPPADVAAAVLKTLDQPSTEGANP